LHCGEAAEWSRAVGDPAFIARSGPAALAALAAPILAHCGAQRILALPDAS